VPVMDGGQRNICALSMLTAVIEPLLWPWAGTTYLYQWHEVSKDDWRADGYRWHQNGPHRRV